MRRFAVLLAAVCISASAFAQDAAAPNPIQALDDCVMGNARALEISGEAADIVAEAAISKCGRELSAAAGRAGALRGASPSRDELRTSMRDAALVAVVELRAQRHTPAPSPAKPIPRKKKL